VNINGAVLIMTVDELETTREIRHAKSVVQSVAVSMDGTTLVTGDNMHQMTIFEIQSGKELAKHRMERDLVPWVGFSVDGRQVVGFDGFAKCVVHDLPK
jgi:tricorn protease-like protein